MPWKECSAISEQISFIEHWEAGETSFAYLCRSFGISRKTGYKRLRRFQELGWEGIADRSRAPHTHRNQTPESVIMALIEAKRSHPTWGPKKLVAWLSQSLPDTVWPAASTAGSILDRAGAGAATQAPARFRGLQPALHRGAASQ